MYKRILVPLDGSMQAEKALQPAVLLAKALSAELLLIRVVPALKSIAPTLEIPWQTQKAEKQQQRIAEAYLRAMRTTGIRHNVRIDRTEVLSGRPAMAIIQFATKERIDLIVCTNRGTAGSRPWGQGSVAMKVLRKAPCDTMMVRSDTQVTLSFTRILDALDGSELAERALVPAVSLAKAMSAEMLLFRATPPIALAIGPDEAEVIKPRLLGQVELYLGQIRDRLMNGRQVEIVAQTGPVAQSILDHAKMKTADLIILTSHGATGSKQWSLGGVANKVLLGARCAVLIVRSGLSG